MPSDTSQPRTSDTLRGILFMCLGVAMFPFLNTFSKLLYVDYPVVEIIWARFIGHFVFVVLIFFPRRGWSLFVANRPVLQVGRSFLLLGATSLFISAIGRVPLATATAIGFTAPLLVTALSVPLLGEAVGLRRWAAVLVGFAGALVIIRPGSQFVDPAVLLLLGQSTCYALYQIATRRSGAHDTAETGIVYAALVGTLVTSIIVPLVFVVPTHWSHWLFFAGLGIAGGSGHYFVTRAFALGRAAVIAPLGYVELIGTVILGYFVFENFPDVWTWVGAALIVASGIYIANRERKLRIAR